MYLKRFCISCGTNPLKMLSISLPFQRSWQNSRPYQMLAEQLGRFAVQTLPEALKKVRITYSGELYNLDTSPLTRMILKGALSMQLSDVNYVNAPHLAQQRGIQVAEEKVLGTRGFTNLIAVEVQAGPSTCMISGTL